MAAEREGARTRKKCPFQCGGELVPQYGREAALLLLNELVSKTSPMRNMLEGAANRNIKGQIQLCSGCGFIAVFKS